VSEWAKRSCQCVCVIIQTVAQCFGRNEWFQSLSAGGVGVAIGSKGIEGWLKGGGTMIPNNCQ
jgi:hypothetical protein